MKIRKYQNSGDLPYMPADNTAVAWNPQRQETIVARQHTPTQELDITDNPMGYAPVVGDILQGGQAIIDFSHGDWKKGALNLALLAVPNVIEKPVKVLKNAVKSRKLAKAVDKLVTNTQLTAKSQPSPSITFKTPPKKEPPTIKITGKDIELNNLIDRFNKFAAYYGYTKVPSGADLSEAEKIMKNVTNL